MTLRDLIINTIDKEVVGPDPHIAYSNPETGEERLLAGIHGSPKKRYGAGMLYPQGISFERGPVDPEEEINENASDKEENESPSGDINFKGGAGGNVDDTESEEPVGLANQFLPSAMGFSIRVIDRDAKLSVSVSSAWYQRGDGHLPVKTLDDSGQIVDKGNGNPFFMKPFWVRRPVKDTIEDIELKDLCETTGKVYQRDILRLSDGEPWLVLEVRNRTTKRDKEEGCCVLTFSLVNCAEATSDHTRSDRFILFQNCLELSAPPGIILPYKEKASLSDTYEEEEMRLLYREKRVYAIGHGCSVNWKVEKDDSVRKIDSVFTPVFEIAPIQPTKHVELSMFELSDRGDWPKAIASLNELVEKYSKWIESLKTEAEKLNENYRIPALRNIAKCETNLIRISKGVAILSGNTTDSKVVKAFRWMNRAMMWQQQRSKTPQRKWLKKGGNRFIPEPLYGGGDRHSSLEDFHKEKGGRWRPFQLAFILMNIEGTISPETDERKIVDLIWFPTGGGKTEAYLGLAAFTILFRRLQGKDELEWEPFYGTTVLMRYTLRLLTTQQYERASSMICGCDLIRKEHEFELGEEPISIGLWVGASTTHNSNKDAVAHFHKLETGKNRDYNFIVMKCPCCGTQMGLIDSSSRRVNLKGLKKDDADNRVFFSCENQNCEYFDEELPLYVVDEDIYQKTPTLILGTVDKFAMLTWKEETSRLFGFRKDNSGDYFRITPPELIIQDELHLISGPLGTIVGLYEVLVQALCTNYGRKDPPFYPRKTDSSLPPKIIASTATISRAGEQVKALYDTDRLNIFPPQGLTFGNTWFSEERKEETGRKYIGILAPGYQSGQTTVVRIYSALLQAIADADFPHEKKDFYWTLVGFFNSIRELGIASSLVNADIAEYLKVLQDRKLIPRDERRYVKPLIELTSRIRSEKIPEHLKELETGYTGKKPDPADICLATNMIATGVDISRLGLMVIHGQPKTTAEYIQASSRVGRDEKGPGLAIVIYSPSKPRDKSQYEHFQAYHSRIYSLVEPTSVTPFSINATQRALHAILIGLVRHFSQKGLRNAPSVSRNRKEFDEIIEWAKGVILERCKSIDPEELEETEKLLSERIQFWEHGFNEYGDAGNYGILKGADAFPLMYASGGEVTKEVERNSLPTPTSMRGVDKESNISIFKP
ncbi:MAG: hypothetical protein H6556_13630 [Lewinellaceae bacterium]|nr:hypothetical protein [Lewinellaceae bacterium]